MLAVTNIGCMILSRVGTASCQSTFLASERQRAVLSTSETRHVSLLGFDMHPGVGSEFKHNLHSARINRPVGAVALPGPQQN
ncbi:hypothetical protein CK203_112944 [Vitis vinifera]|uniref:Uncharacterized protein n=1 Tax=Vitis vinifera TaxID=29760 RepID=A0A438CBH8_VITVI|nr:hypothetical protein CK203_112944 [Vitis vinifera]